MNFTYLKNNRDFSALFECCNECELFVHDRPNISITAARKAMEYMVKLLYGTQINPEIRGLTLFDMLSDYDFMDYINNRMLLDAIHLIRKKGNQAVHEGNMSSQDAMLALEKLHYVTGEVCIKLGIIESYLPFNPNIVQEKPVTGVPKVLSEEPIVDEALIRRVSALMRRRVKPASFSSSSGKVINVHVDPSKDAKAIAEQKMKKGTDSGANGKIAYQYLAKYISDQLSGVQVLMEPVRSELILVRDSKDTVVSIKTGCTNLGTKDYKGNWQLLPGVDYVLYAPEVTSALPTQEQFRLFSRDDFLAFWEDLGLLRTKVSTAMRKRIAEQVGPDEKITAEKYADVISIQSFTNSGRKLPLVLNGLKVFPVLAEIDWDKYL